MNAFVAVIFLAVSSASVKKVHALDCDFERDTCGYKSENSWIRVSGDIINVNPMLIHDIRPKSDHTRSKSKDGYYMSLSGLPIISRIKSGIRLVSPFVSSVKPTCLRFWYYNKNSHKTKLIVKLRQNVGEDMIIWTPTAHTKQPWTEAVINLSGFIDEFQITFEVIQSYFSAAGVAIDDIVLQRHFCNGTIPTDKSEQITTAKVLEVSRSTPTITEDIDTTTIPTTNPYDGTTSTISLFTSTLGKAKGDIVYISPVLNIQPPLCVEFRYIVYDVKDCEDARLCKLIAVVKQGERNTVLWSSKANTKKPWTNAALQVLDIKSTFQVFFQVTKPTSSTIDVQVEDVFYRPGKCM